MDWHGHLQKNNITTFYASENALESMSSSAAPRGPDRWGRLALLPTQQRCGGQKGLLKATQLHPKDLDPVPP